MSCFCGSLLPTHSVRTVPRTRPKRLSRRVMVCAVVSADLTALLLTTMIIEEKCRIVGGGCPPSSQAPFQDEGAKAGRAQAPGDWHTATACTLLALHCIHLSIYKRYKFPGSGPAEKKAGDSWPCRRGDVQDVVFRQPALLLSCINKVERPCRRPFGCHSKSRLDDRLLTG